MGRYDAATGVEGEYEPGSRGRVLRNLRGIRTKREMDEAEEGALLEVQRRYVETIAVDHPFKSADLRQMHRDWLGAIYPWAGNYRTVEMSKGGFVWPPARLVGQNMERFERDTLKRLMPLAGEDDAIIARALAEVQVDRLLIHPFREGNGRLSRWFVDLLAMQGEER